ncbi:uncharacterized protein LOC135502304 isoform X2 [Lineus longissimus]|uniref:uncharacterized protein LOC135502304 isoform X2 n=1 Tax=Lineus longissimus TaxID=88925 RepID=UPI00315D4FFC
MTIADYMRRQCKPLGYYEGSIGRCRPCSAPCKVSGDSCICIRSQPSSTTSGSVRTQRSTKETRHTTPTIPNVQVISKTTVNENESMQFQCVTSGGSPEHITRYQWLWKKIGSTAEEIIQDTRTSTQNGKILEYARIPYDKSGMYTCKAWNIRGIGQASVNLSVQYPPRLPPGLKLKSDVVGENGKEATFELLITANPIPANNGYVWSKVKDGIPLAISSREYEIFSGSTWSKLIIKNVKSHDYTHYTCSVKTNGFQAKIFKFRLIKAAVEISEITVTGRSRTDNRVTISWKQVIGTYTVVKVKYCQTGTDYCENYIVPNTEDTTATWFVDPDKTYYYYIIMEDGDIVVYMSNRLVVVDDSDDRERMVGVYFSVGLIGAVMLTTTVVILAFAPWKQRLDLKRSKKTNQPANDSCNDDAARNPLTSIRKRPAHTYANTDPDFVNDASPHSKRPAHTYANTDPNFVNDASPHSKRPAHTYANTDPDFGNDASTHSKHTADKHPAQPRVKRLPVTVRFEKDPDEPACSDNAMDIDSYDYIDNMWQSDASDSDHSPVPACRTSQATLLQDVSALIQVQVHQADQPDQVKTSSYENMQNLGHIESTEWQRDQEQEGTYNDVRTVVTQSQPQHSMAESGISQATRQQDTLGQQSFTARQAYQTDRDDASSHEGMRGFHHYVSCEGEMNQTAQEPEDSYDDVRIVRQGQSGQSTAESGTTPACLAKESTPCSSNDDVADDGRQSLYEHLQPVSKNDYLDFKGLSAEELRPRMLLKVKHSSPDCF